MNKEPIITDQRLLYFRALARGLDSGLVDRATLNRFIEDGAEMAYVFARRYRTVVYSADLAQASDCVLGVINLGLVKASNDQPEAALKFLLGRGLIGAFRAGWSGLVALAGQIRAVDRSATVFQLESDLADSISARPGRRWVGYEEYLRLWAQYDCSEGNENEPD